MRPGFRQFFSAALFAAAALYTISGRHTTNLGWIIFAFCVANGLYQLVMGLRRYLSYRRADLQARSAYVTFLGFTAAHAMIHVATAQGPATDRDIAIITRFFDKQVKGGFSEGETRDLVGQLANVDFLSDYFRERRHVLTDEDRHAILFNALALLHSKPTAGPKEWERLNNIRRALRLPAERLKAMEEQMALKAALAKTATGG